MTALFEAIDVVEDFAPRSAAINMALDEALLQAVRSPTLRFYRWKEPAVTFGYFGRFSDATEFAAGRDLVRRWTGGGIVPHGDDLTYAIIIPAPDGKSSLALYEAIHAALSSALREHSVNASLTAEAPSKISDACFANPVRADVMLDGTKIAGAAHRRTKTGLLHQGSIQLRNLGPQFPISFAHALAGLVTQQRLAQEIASEAARIAERKYATPAWNQRR